MDFEEKLALVKRNTEEIVEEKELIDLLKKKKAPVVYCGYEPSNPPHMGNLVTTTKLIDLQNAGFKVKFLLADMHAYTNLKGDVAEIDKQCEMWKKAIKAFGLDAEFVKGSSFQFEKDYWMNIINMSLKISVNRGLRAMQELARDIENAKISQMLYPLMQAEDFHALDCDVAVGGIDQRKVHMLARENLEKKPICIHTPMIVSLLGAGQKMSKSIPGSGITLADDEETVNKSIKNAYCPAGILEDNPVLQLAKYIILPRGELKVERPEKFGGNVSFESYEELTSAFRTGKLHPMDLKTAVAKELNNIIAPARKFFKN